VDDQIQMGEVPALSASSNSAKPSVQRHHPSRGGWGRPTSLYLAPQRSAAALQQRNWAPAAVHSCSDGSVLGAVCEGPLEYLRRHIRNLGSRSIAYASKTIQSARQANMCCWKHSSAEQRAGISEWQKFSERRQMLWCVSCRRREPHAWTARQCPSWDAAEL